ncbi:MAG TPA: hypothetical protein PLU52_09530 [Opitutaceae bacterium]|nr:hypothetical protein [Opitutaceae bacterium]HND61849.1 hypothetical protein [Opitutaceae bacterium]
MKKTPYLPLAAVLGLLAAGCTAIVDPSVAINARIQEKNDTYVRMTPVAQKTVQSGTIVKGFTSDMVYMALGKPATVQTKDTSLGKLQMWTYVVFTSQGPTAQHNLNNPDTPGYIPMLTATNAPEHSGQPGATASMAFGFGASKGYSMGQLNVPDMKQDKLYVFFANDQVTEIKYDGNGT